MKVSEDVQTPVMRLGIFDCNGCAIVSFAILFAGFDYEMSYFTAYYGSCLVWRSSRKVYDGDFVDI
eukprot:snap_masked-scaffold_7-processed-gene-16.34-mRNA-1 protein AED:1.00 eAED:1.00 QI:0/-1/0/0/-1/1/1/0/65